MTIITLPYPTDSAELFTKLRHLPYAIYYDSCYPHSQLGRYDIISASPIAHVILTQAKATLYEAGRATHVSDDPFCLLQTLLKRLPTLKTNDLPFTGGLLGYAGYDVNQVLQGIAPYAANASTLPSLVMGLYTWAIIVDHQQCLAYFYQGDTNDAGMQEAYRLLQGDAPMTEPSFALTTSLQPAQTYSDYQVQFDQIKAYIKSGDCYQVNLTQPFIGRYAGDVWQAYQQLRRTNPAPYAVYFNMPSGQVLSLSPERFITVDADHVLTSPIKGTIKRHPNPVRDQALAMELLNSEKDRAENVMIVDLMRNDLSQVCQAGSVKVPSLFELLPYPSVHHLVSHVTGTLRHDSDALALFKRCLPGGSITGAPKVRAMQIIRELEPVPRQVYCGSFAYFSCNRRMDSNIAIRTLMTQGDHIACHSGGGIVADSNCQAEYQELQHKISRIMACLHRYS